MLISLLHHKHCEERTPVLSVPARLGLALSWHSEGAHGTVQKASVSERASLTKKREVRAVAGPWHAVRLLHTLAFPCLALVTMTVIVYKTAHSSAISSLPTIGT